MLASKMAAFRRSRFMVTFGPSTACRGEDLSTSSTPASPARTSLVLDRGSGSTDRGQDSGGKPCGSFATWNRTSSSWRTPRSLFDEGSTVFSDPWPNSGSMRNGACFRQEPAEPHTYESGSGSWVPTPTAGDAKSSGSRNLSGSKAHRGVSLTDWVRFGNSTTRRRWLPTPCARDYRHPNKQPFSDRGGGKKGEQLPNAIGGPLNPTWIEWLMAWPNGWTDCAISAKDKFRSWLRRLSGS